MTAVSHPFAAALLDDGIRQAVRRTRAKSIQSRSNDMLTEAERKTLNDAMAIIEGRAVEGASWMIDIRRHGSLGAFHDLTYFDSNPRGFDRQHNNLAGKTFADKVQAAIEIEAGAADRRQANIQRLREELAALEQAA